MNEERIYKVLLGPLVSEKASLAAESGQVVFRVATNSTKAEIKKAVETLFDVKVEGVQVSNLKGKTKRTVRGLGKRKDTKKAYVRLAEGQDIDFMDVE
ncbi:50S ribosomal protein L23 [Alkalimarinus sediminis]|uniref:Large ribosomal subunit protein uL23 n=1 Tax=Alkalimarinus sediminis TaxID=1632866 RepID=A0A9E8HIP8_9ALTE|nr:50S ribosomal protein L23 [Alkalimarinus sediminis]UZW75403.1 50S ribosomal protein L23 [Alkalimarinus sediminis]